MDQADLHQSRPARSALHTALLTCLHYGVRGYQLGISPFLGQSCRFYPSCSNYALQAWQEHGAAKGSWLFAKRICKCHPWHPGGVDPVPQAACAQQDTAPATLTSSPTARGCNHS